MKNNIEQNKNIRTNVGAGLDSARGHRDITLINKMEEKQMRKSNHKTIATVREKITDKTGTMHRAPTGITLIALIITVIVLLILAGVAVNMLVGENGILSHTQTSTDKYSIESAKEELRLDILNIQTEILKTEGRKATLEDMQARIDLAKYEIELHYELVATSTPVANPATYSIVNRIGTNYYFTVDDKLIITNVEEITEENSPISKFTIKLSDTTYKETTVTLNEIPTSEAGTIEKYDYVAQTADDKIELTNITETTKKITGLTEQTTYKVYVIVYDNAGNKRKSEVVTITTPEYVPPTIWTKPGQPRSGIDLDTTYGFTWSDIAEIAKIISNTLTDDKTSNDITKDMFEISVAYNNRKYILGVGDRMKIDGKIVRILGFNHDDLVDQTVYGGTNVKAGISFEYVDMYATNQRFNKENNTLKGEGTGNYGGWGASELRGTMNGTYYNDIKAKIGEGVIKQVKKEYAKKVSTDPFYANDYLWLLSNSEIWSFGGTTNSKGSTIVSGYYGAAEKKEGNQYKYYSLINATWYSTSGSSVYLVKPSKSNARSWWLRTVCYCCSRGKGTVDQNGKNSPSRNTGSTYYFDVAPGFCV